MNFRMTLPLTQDELILEPAVCVRTRRARLETIDDLRLFYLRCCSINGPTLKTTSCHYSLTQILLRRKSNLITSLGYGASRQDILKVKLQP